MIKIKMSRGINFGRFSNTWMKSIQCPNCKKKIRFFYATPITCEYCHEYIDTEYTDLINKIHIRISWHRGFM
jgi:hypothetical protein